MPRRLRFMCGDDAGRGSTQMWHKEHVGQAPWSVFTYVESHQKPGQRNGQQGR